MTISETEAQIINENSENIDMQDIGLFWQLTIKTIDDLRIVGSEHLTLEMYVMQLTHVINIESNTKIDSHDNTNLNLKRKNLISEEFAVEKKEEKKISTEAKNQLKNTDQIKNKPQNNDTSKNFENRIQISSFQDLIELANNLETLLMVYLFSSNY